MPRAVTTFFIGVGLFFSVATADEFTQCYDFGCKSQQAFSLSDVQWSNIASLFSENAVLNASSERQAIRAAIALIEEYSGAITGTHLDKAGNYPGYDIPMQMDCIDESTNTQQYLAALERRNLLRWHSVEQREHRIIWFVDHWTAVISEQASAQKYAVDSWYRDNGELPLLQALEDWRRKKDFPTSLNPELAEAT